MPEAWKHIRLCDVLQVLHGYAFASEEMSEDLTGNPVIVNIGNFNYRGGFRFHSTRVREFTGRYPEKFELSPGDLLLAMTCQTPDGSILGLPAAVPDDGRSYLHNQRIGKVVTEPGVLDRRFAYYVFLWSEVNRQLVATASGTKILHTAPSRIGAVEIDLPPLCEQEAISSILSALDDKIAVNDRIAEESDALTREIFRYDFLQSRRNEHLLGWREGVLSDICTTQYGYTASADQGAGPKFLRVKDINKQNWIEWSSVPHCKISDSDRVRYSLSVGDVVVARMADPGKSAIVESPVSAVFASYLVRLKAESLAHSYYIYGILKSDAYSEYAAASKSGSVQANMNAKVIVGARVVIPPVELLEAHLARILPLRRRLTASLHESSVLKELRDTLLPKLMSGEIRVRDAEKVVEDVT